MPLVLQSKQGTDCVQNLIGNDTLAEGPKPKQPNDNNTNYHCSTLTRQVLPEGAAVLTRRIIYCICAMYTNSRGATQLRAGPVLSPATSPALCASRRAPRLKHTDVKRHDTCQVDRAGWQIHVRVRHHLRSDGPLPQ